jgi:hypothetical protein
VTATTVSGGTFSVTFTTAAGRHYSLEACSDFVHWASVSGSAFTGDGQPHTSAVDAANTQYFVRVLVGP